MDPRFFVPLVPAAQARTPDAGATAAPPTPTQQAASDASVALATAGALTVASFLGSAVRGLFWGGIAAVVVYGVRHRGSKGARRKR